MAELVVVSAIIIGTMATFYASYSKVVTRYKRIINYYDVGTVYRLGDYYERHKDTINGKTTISDIISGSEAARTVNGVKYNDKVLAGTCQNFKSYSTTGELKEYINFMKDKIKTQSATCVVLESCQEKNSKTKCKYAFMEVENETP